MTAALYWLIAVVVLVVIECISMGLTTIWFAAGALIAALAAMCGAIIVIQSMLFVVISVAMLFFTRPWAVRFLNNRTVKTNAESLIGKTAIVTTEINNLQGEGQIMVQGLHWTARSTDDQVVILKDTKVTIKEINGVKCIVEPLQD